MKIQLSSAAPSELIESAAACLRAAGHDVRLDKADVEDRPDVVIALVAAEAEAAALFSLWEAAKSAHDSGVPVMGASTASVAALPAAVASMPHDGEWEEVTVGNGGVGQELPAALEHFRTAMSPVARDIPGHDGRLARLHAGRTSAAKKLVTIKREAQARRRRTGEEREKSLRPPAQKVFLSYSTRDKLAENVRNELERAGYDVFFGQDSIPGSADWRAIISSEIRQSDKFVSLLSPNVLKHPKYPKEELWLAQHAGVELIPVRLRRTGELGEGFDLVFSGIQIIDLFPDFNAGMQRLFSALGGAYPENEQHGIRDRAGRAGEVAVRFARQHEIGAKVKKYGGAAAAGAGVVALAAAKAWAAQEQAHAAEKNELLGKQAEVDQERFDAAVRDYVERTLRLLNSGLSAAQYARDMGPTEYREEFRPRFMKVLGGLSEIRPVTADLVDRHQRLIDDLENLLEQFDTAVAKADRGEAEAYRRSIAQLNDAWATTMSSSVEWLRMFVGESQ
ncbi:MAG TPA: toll/interleukin-1 receptor domain-containing protein [Nocardioidaceae bacterium]|nr:toll/interleukin-1 receptor domain-containing protein [Nocardioidaceae bacterium]